MRVAHLRAKGFIEDRKPNVYISCKIAHETAQQADYMKQCGIDSEYCRKIIVDYLTKFKIGTREDFERVIMDKLLDVLSDTQKKNKICNVLQDLKSKGVINLADQNNWRLDGDN